MCRMRSRDTHIYDVPVRAARVRCAAEAAVVHAQCTTQHIYVLVVGLSYQYRPSSGPGMVTVLLLMMMLH